MIYDKPIFQFILLLAVLLVISCSDIMVEPDPDYNYGAEKANNSADNDLLTQNSTNIEKINLKIRLMWNDIPKGLDLHLVKSDSNFMSETDDCHYKNTNPDWGAAGNLHNPHLSNNSTNDTGEEEITIKNVFPDSYTMYAHYNFTEQDNNSDETKDNEVNIIVYINEIERRSFNYSNFQQNMLWNVAKIQWSTDDEAEIISNGSFETY